MTTNPELMPLKYQAANELSADAATREAKLQKLNEAMRKTPHEVALVAGHLSFGDVEYAKTDAGHNATKKTIVELLDASNHGSMVAYAPARPLGSHNQEPSVRFTNAQCEEAASLAFERDEDGEDTPLAKGRKAVQKLERNSPEHIAAKRAHAAHMLWKVASINMEAAGLEAPARERYIPPVETEIRAVPQAESQAQLMQPAEAPALFGGSLAPEAVLVAQGESILVSA